MGQGTEMGQGTGMGDSSPSMAARDHSEGIISDVQEGCSPLALKAASLGWWWFTGGMQKKSCSNINRRQPVIVKTLRAGIHRVGSHT
jgi:hypothetical protein